MLGRERSGGDQTGSTCALKSLRLTQRHQNGTGQAVTQALRVRPALLSVHGAARQCHKVRQAGRGVEARHAQPTKLGGAVGAVHVIARPILLLVDRHEALGAHFDAAAAQVLEEKEEMGEICLRATEVERLRGRWLTTTTGILSLERRLLANNRVKDVGSGDQVAPRRII